MENGPPFALFVLFFRMERCLAYDQIQIQLASLGKDTPDLEEQPCFLLGDLRTLFP